MDASTAQKQLIETTLAWSLKSFASEVSADFPILSTYGLNNRYIMGFIYWFRTLDDSMKLVFKEFLPRYALRMPYPNEDELRKMVYTGSTLSRDAVPALQTADTSAKTYKPIDRHFAL